MTAAKGGDTSAAEEIRGFAMQFDELRGKFTGCRHWGVDFFLWKIGLPAKVFDIVVVVDPDESVEKKTSPPSCYMAYMDPMGMYRRITKIYWLVGWLKRGMCHPANDSGTECQQNICIIL